MNVLKEQIDVLKIAQILLEITPAHVALAIVWQMMDKHAMVIKFVDLVYDHLSCMY